MTSIESVPLYLIERSAGERIEFTSENVRHVDEINAGEGARWLFSFLSADRLKSYCVYEATSPDAI